jgi:geranylgeranyl diphosphate synthase type 3
MNRDCVPLVNVLGSIFQICDDYLNLSNTTYSKNKGLCEDLTEGKFSFPIIHSIRADPSNVQLINILKQKTRDDEVKLYAVSYMERTGSFAYTRNVVAELREKAHALIDDIGGVHDDKAREGEDGGQLVQQILEKMMELTLKDGPPEK